MNVVALIPARYRSSRFPGKPLVSILGVPMIVRVARIAQRALGAGRVYVATDDDRIADVARAHDVQVVMTSSAALTGTDRLAEAAERIDADVYVNVQGDEPMLDPDVIARVIAAKRDAGPGVVVNAMARLSPGEDPASPHLPKVVADERGRLVYMSRAAVPGRKDPATPVVHRKQVCVYAFERAHLRAFAALGRKADLEALEDIEILRFVELDVPVQMIEVAGGSLAVDIPDDVARVEAAMRASGLR
jgi:3-deoxy-manno-octulosonate cytidylyltransferase (CMP-KDO synthetase)